MSSNLRVNNILPSVGTNVAIGTAGGSITLTGGVTGSSIINTGVTTVSAGSTAAPSISPSGDSNTGIFFPSADTIAFGEGGVEAARIDSNGNLGINTTSVSAKLQVHNNITTAYANISPTLSNVTNAWVNSSPHVSGGTFVGAQYNLPGDGQNRIAYIGAISESASNKKSSLVFGTDEGGNRTEKVRITGDGNLGIGNNNPSTKLDLLGSHSSGLITTLLKISGNAWSVNGGSALEFGHDPATYPTWVTGRIASTYSGGSWGGGLKFFYNNGTTSGSLTEGMELTRDGNLAFPSGKGIDFSATANGSGSVSSEVLDDYEIGSWTPTLTFGGGATGLTYARQFGRYVKIGNYVQVVGHFQISTVGSSTGSAVVGGLPFNYGAITGGYFVPMGVRGGLNVSGLPSVSFYVSSGGGSTLPIYVCGTSGGGNATVGHTAFATNTEIDICVSYYI